MGSVFYLQAREKEEKKLKAKQKETARLQVATSLNEFGAGTLGGDGFVLISSSAGSSKIGWT